MKEFFTYEQQLAKLKSDGLIIANEKDALYYLKFEGYHNLINGYSFIFKGLKGFVKGTTFEHIKQLYLFDRALRGIIYKYTLIIENHIKALVSHEFSLEHGVNEKKYLDPKCFTSNKNMSDNVKNLLLKCKEIIRNGKHEKSNKYREFISYNQRVHGNVPFWVLVRALSLGAMSMFYKVMIERERNNIARNYNISSDELSNLLELLVDYRNIVAHGERIFCAKLAKSRLSSNLIVVKKMSIPRNEDGSQRYGRRDFLALMIIFKYLLPEDEFSLFMSEFKGSLSNFKKHINPWIPGRIEKEMGLCIGSWKIMDKIIV